MTASNFFQHDECSGLMGVESLGLVIINKILLERRWVKLYPGVGIGELTAKNTGLVLQDQPEPSPNKRGCCKCFKRPKLALREGHHCLLSWMHYKVISMFVHYLNGCIFCITLFWTHILFCYDVLYVGLQIKRFVFVILAWKNIRNTPLKLFPPFLFIDI